jgi:prepilin-type N-terminal cleavage/methylation domain-containing protein
MIINFYKKGFTLVELLVVIAIVGLLSTIVLVATSDLSSQANLTKILAWARSINSTLGLDAVGIWNLDENPASQGTTIKDLSGWGNNGTLNTGETGVNKSVSGVVGNAISFDGVDDYMNCGNNTSLNITSAGTWEVWLKINSKSSNAEIFDKFTGYYNGYRLFCRSSDGVWLQAGNGTGTINSPNIPVSRLPDNVWHHIMITKDGSGFKIYHNGILYNSNSITNNITANTKSLVVGYNNYNDGDGRFFDGFIDEIRIYNIALTTAQVQASYYVGLNILLAKGLMEESEYWQRL